MSQKVIIEGVQYMSAAYAADSFGFNKDYVARLARSGKIPAKREGRVWYVAENSFKEYIIYQEYFAAQRKSTLMQVRRREYSAATNKEPHMAIDGKPASVRHANRSITGAAKTLQAHSIQVAPLYAVNPLVDFLHKVASIATAVIIVFGGYGLFEVWTHTDLLAQYRLTLPALVEYVVH